MRSKVVGVLTGNERGYAFLTPEGEKSNIDYFIPASELKGALHGDRVMCEISEEDGKFGKRTVGRVLKIIERGTDRIVGTYFRAKSGGIITADDSRFSKPVFVPFGKEMRAMPGDKVVVKILTYPFKRPPEGMVIKILGKQFSRSAELKSVIYTYKLPEKFKKEVIDEADNLPCVSEKDLIGRADLRSINTFTIDGDDAKDFDDAVSIKKVNEGYELGVHIADVSHYVKLNGKIDVEALRRGTSVYFPEQVIPMLPERLSNDLCSLREGVDRLTLSCIISFNYEGKVKGYKILPSVINSKKRATYSKVLAVLDGDDVAIKEYVDIKDDIYLMAELADILEKRSEEQGSVNLDVKESSISVAKDGNITVKAAVQDKARKLIEQFMIAANCCVAEYLFFAEQPCIYRIHEKPTEEKTDKFYAFLSAVGVAVKRNKTVYPKDFAVILEKTEDLPSHTVINRVMLRSMQKAKYSPDDVGHFGLSKDHYCHFTSPIRRYPDLTVHRILKDFIAGNDTGKYSDLVYSVAAQSSEREKVAQDAERAVDDFYKTLYADEHVGEEFDAVISGVTSFGLFAELENGVEGLIKLETLKGKRFTFDENRFSLSSGKKTYVLGQPVKIKIVGIDLSQRKSEFMLIE
ncbi:MAG: ribonuclease R [Clostridia bacterium]|nr:ribonuclease R [Clostridia bacterium]